MTTSEPSEYVKQEAGKLVDWINEQSGLELTPAAKAMTLEELLAAEEAGKSLTPVVEPVEYFGNWRPEPRPTAVCNGCLLEAVDIEEYVLAATQVNAELEPGEREMTPDDYVWQEEGTLNRENGHFLCTRCYIAAGMPSSERGWVAP
jgi:hypothetical protein